MTWKRKHQAGVDMSMAFVRLWKWTKVRVEILTEVVLQAALLQTTESNENE